MIRHAACILLALLAVAAATADDATVTVRTLDGRTMTGELSAWSDATLTITAEGKTYRLPAADLQSINAQRDGAAPTPTAVLFTDDNAVLAADAVALIDAELVTDTAFGKLKPDADAVEMIVWPAAHESADAVRDAVRRAGVKRGESDVVVVRAAGELSIIRGIIESLDADGLRLNYDGRSSTLKRDNVAALLLARLTEPATTAADATVHTTDGSRLAVNIKSLKDTQLTVDANPLGVTSIDFERVRAINFRSNRLVPLTKLEPASVAHVPFFDHRRPPRSEAGDMHVHARTQMTWRLGGDYTAVSMTVGINRDVAAGAALLTAHLDGKPLVDRRLLKRSDEPFVLQLDVTGGQQFELIVDFADGTFGAGAAVTIADATLIRERKADASSR